MQNNQFRTLVIVLGIVLIAFLRFALLDYANFAPIAAAGIFGLYFLQKKQMGIVFALAALFLSDLVLQATQGNGLYWERSADYIALIAALAIGFAILRSKQNMTRAILGAAAGSVVFFLLSNFAVWALGSFYAKTPAGLLTCYEMAIPFFRGTLIGDLFFTTVFVGGFQLLSEQVPFLQAKKA